MEENIYSKFTYEFQKIKNFENELFENFDYNKQFSCSIVGLSITKYKQAPLFNDLVDFFNKTTNEYNVEIKNNEIRFKFPFANSLKQPIYCDQESYLKENVFEKIENTLKRMGFFNIEFYSRMD